MLAMSPYKTFQDGFIFTVKTDNPGTSNSNQFTLPLTTETYDYTINWGDGIEESFSTSSDQTHTYLSAGTYTIRISGVFPAISFLGAGDSLKIISIEQLGSVGWLSLSSAFQGCNNLAYVKRGGILNNVSTAFGAWRECYSLTEFSYIDTSSIQNFQWTWLNCGKITNFPMLDTSNGTNFVGTWRNMVDLLTFPLLDINNGATFREAWKNCSSLTDFPSGLFDNWIGIPANRCFDDTWDDCNALTAQSVENILVSIDTSGVNAPGGATAGDNYIEIDYNVATGGLTAATNTAITNLKAKGWEPFINGVLV